LSALRNDPHGRETTTHPVSCIAVARAHDGEIDRKHERLDADRPRALQQLAHVAAVAHHVQLEPERHLRGGAYFLERAQAHRG
jgi:hypothetical protein